MIFEKEKKIRFESRSRRLRINSNDIFTPFYVVMWKRHIRDIIVVAFRNINLDGNSYPTIIGQWLRYSLLGE